MDPSRELIGRSPKITLLRDQIRALVTREAGLHRHPPLLITGETGTGKGLLANIIHKAGSRASGEFVELNGAALPEHLLESELFGYERGAFTDARQSKPGLLQVANRGTLFLDEVGLLPPTLQAKLLKVLEDNKVRRLGSTRSEPIDVSIISATNADLPALVRAHRFREDLYHRLAVITLWIPPLRERGDDIELLAEHAIAKACEKYGVPLKRLSSEALAVMKAYRWPGNVRELNSLMERVALLCPESLIPSSALALQLDQSLDSHEQETRPRLNAAEWERQNLAGVLAETDWNITRTAVILGITRNTVRARIAKHGLRPADESAPLADSPSAEGPDVTASSSDLTRLARASESGGRDRNPGLVPLSPPGQSLPGAEVTARSPIDLVRGRPSIAVLPFRDDGEHEGDSYFGNGIVEDIVGAFASLHELLVISRSSTIRYRGTRVDVCEVGRDLKVTYALSGSVRRAAPRLRVSVELAETSHGAVVWANHFDGNSEDLFALQDQIASRVVSTIVPQVREAELRRALRKRPDSMEAYDCVLRALSQIYRLKPDDFAEARTWLEKAVTLDPAYATPYALLAIWHSIRFGQGWSSDPAADQAEVMRLASAAVERDSFDAMALALCGHAKSILLHEFDEAITLFDRALAASPNSAIAWTRSSPTYSYLGDSREAVRRAQQGLRLSPFDPHIFYAHSILGLGHYVGGDYEEAARWGRIAREENAQFTANLRLLAASLGALGLTEEAHDVRDALLSVEPKFEVARFVARYAIRDPDRSEQLARHLRLAGLPG
jgi:transcriptional regulator with AAA-type ATPase domain/TolB-like protein/tetratricopeptide (TPR) repeat protein